MNGLTFYWNKEHKKRRTEEELKSVVEEVLKSHNTSSEI